MLPPLLVKVKKSINFYMTILKLKLVSFLVIKLSKLVKIH